MEESLEVIGKAIEQYKLRGRALTIEQLLRLKDLILTHGYTIAEELALLKINYNWAYFDRKINFFRSKNAFLNQGETATAAESLSEEQGEGNRKREIELEGTAYRLELLYKHSLKIADAIAQRVSVLKKEAEANIDHT